MLCRPLGRSRTSFAQGKHARRDLYRFVVIRSRAGLTTCACRQSSHWSPFSKSVDRSVQSRLYGFQQRYVIWPEEAAGSFANQLLQNLIRCRLRTGRGTLQSYLLPGVRLSIRTSLPCSACALGPFGEVSFTQLLTSICSSGGGALVECGVREVAGELQHVQPLIYRSSTAIIIFYGFLSNVDELAKRLEAEGSVGLPFGRTAAAKAKLYTGQSQHHSEAAEALLELYLHTRANDLLIMLSELQVCFCCRTPPQLAC